MIQFNFLIQNILQQIKKYFFLICLGDYCDQDGNYFRWKFHPLTLYIVSGQYLSAFIDCINEPEKRLFNEEEKALIDFIEDYWINCEYNNNRKYKVNGIDDFNDKNC